MCGRTKEPSDEVYNALGDMYVLEGKARVVALKKHLRGSMAQWGFAITQIWV